MREKVFFGIGMMLAVGAVMYSGVAHALLYFVMIGAVPGTALSLSPTVMLTLATMAAWACLVLYAQRRMRGSI